KLLEQGISQAAVDRLHAPIGLAIGAETEMEIAVSVLAEIIKAGRHKNTFPAKLCAAALKAEQPFVLATIICRQGSAPRDIGTKMLIFADTIVASIGGGTLEARIIKRGRKMLADKETKDVWEQVDLTGAHQETGYMLCGGMVDVLLEYVDPAEEGFT
ncbi:MAG: XdhC family protein, partial [Selenomonas sp.]|nr:XdhC family protein [Selenomonas sp.]